MGILRLVLYIGALIATMAVEAVERPYAVVKVPVANLREAPRHGAEMVSQGIMGTPVIIKDKAGEWLKIEMPDGYEGYMIDNSLQPMSQSEFDAWRSSKRYVVTAMATELKDAPDKDGDTVTPLQLADIIQIEGEVPQQGFAKAVLPDGRKGFIAVEDIIPFVPFGRSDTDSLAQLIISRGKKMLGQEYLWGGTSAKGNDCSGFTRVCYQSAGVYLPRDAWQQALAGEAVAEKDLKPGDLIFFTNNKGRVVHVGMYIGDGLMMHSSGRVKIDRILASQSHPEMKLYYRKPAKYRRMLTGAPLESDTKANKLYFNN